MKSLISKLSVFVMILALGLVFGASSAVFADETEEGGEKPATSISISPVSKILQLTPNNVYEDTFVVTNSGGDAIDFEVYAAPYSYTYSEENDAYQLGFNRENSFTQITRWITFSDNNGNYAEKVRFKAEPKQAVKVSYRISTPSSLPAGGQYAVLFAHTLSGSTNSSGIKTEASPGLVVYGRAEGETRVEGEISNLEIFQTMQVENDTKNIINATSKVKNTGNVDFMAFGKLKVDGIFGINYYETPVTTTRSRVSIIPEAELPVGDSWDQTPYFGLFNVTWTVEAADKSETITKTVLIMPPLVIIIAILLLTTLIIWITIMVRKRKERRSRFMV